MLWGKVLGASRAWLLTHDADPLDETHVAAYKALETRRLAGEPMAYILGEREFYGHVFRVTPDVLIPRPETEGLVECALEAVHGVPAPRILDLGTGSGAVAVSIAVGRPDARVMATDISEAALGVARENAACLGANLLFCRGNWYDSLFDGTRYDVIVSNPPYVDAQDAHLCSGDVRFEPRDALTDGADGLSALRRIVHGAPDHLRPGGALCLEHGWDQAAAVQAMLDAGGFVNVSSLRDLAQLERVTWGRLPGPINRE